jgi:hypothetical protein
MKRPSDTIRDFCFDNLEKSLENQRFNFSNSEKFMLWIVGFSIGGLSIIVTNLTEFNQIFKYSITKTVLILLVISIVFGIFYRLAFYLYQIKFQGVEFYLRGALSNPETVMQINTEDISEIDDINEIVHLIKIDFGDDKSNLLEVYTNVDEATKAQIIQDLKEYYLRMGEWAKKDYELGMTYIKDIYKNALGVSQKKIDKIADSYSAKSFQIFGFITISCLIISLLSFVFVLIILCIKY